MGMDKKIPMIQIVCDIIHFGTHLRHEIQDCRR